MALGHWSWPGPYCCHRGPFECCLGPPSGPGLGWLPLAFTCVGVCVCVFLHELLYVCLSCAWSVYVCVGVYACVCFRMSLLCMCICTCICVGVRMCWCVCMCVAVWASHAPMCARVCVHVYACLCLCMSISVCACMCVSVYWRVSVCIIESLSFDYHLFFIYSSLPKLQFQITMKSSSSLKCLECAVNHTYQWHLFLGWEQRLLNRSHMTVWSLCENKSWATPHLQTCFQEGKNKCLLV